MKKELINLRKLWFSLLLLVGITATAYPGIQQVTEATNVAEINGTGYETLQAAVDAAFADMTGDITITMTSDFTGNTVIRQKAGLNLTISGGKSSAKKTITGQILIDGDGRAAGTETLTIQYITFKGSKSDFFYGDAFVLIPSVKSLPAPYYRNSYNYAHNVTLSSCDFNCSSNAMDVVGIKANSNAGAYNLTLKSVSGNSLHSLAQLTGTTGASFSSCKATDTGSFINVSGGGGEYTISGCTFPSSKEDGYAIRIKDNSSATVTLKGTNNLNATDVVINKATGGANIAIENGSYTGKISGTGSISISGGSFYNCGDISSYYAEGFNPTTCIINGEEVLTGKNVLFTNLSGAESLKDFSSSVLSASGTYKLLTDVTSTARITPGTLASSITLDLNGHTLTSTATDYAVLLSRAGSATTSKTFNLIDSSEGKGGKLVVNSAANTAFQVQGKYNELTIGEGVTVEGGCVALLSENNKLTVEGTIKGGDDFAIATNGSSTKDATIDIKSGAVISSNSVAMYLPGTGTTTIEEGSSVTGSTAIYIKSGTLNIAGGEITGNGAKADFTHNGNGVNSTGNALAVENCNYPGGAPVVNITGGTFISANNTAIASYAYGEGMEPIAHFVSGGKFSSELDENICAVGMGTAGSVNSEGLYELVEYVAQIGTAKYETFEAAFAAVQDGETITLLADCTGNGIKALQGKFTNGITVDFGGHTYTMDGAMVGSTGTQTQAFQLLKDNKITFKNGTIYSEKALFLVQNYSDLTLEGMTLTLNNANYTSAYTLSNNNGNIVIDGTTINANPAGGFAFDVCRYSSYTSVNVEVKGESVINGDIEISASGSDAKDGFGLTLTAGTLNGDIVVDASAAAAMAATPEKTVIAKSDSFSQEAPEGYKWVSGDNGVSTLAACEYVAQIGTAKYETFEAAFAAVQDGETITLLADCTGNGIKALQGKFANGITVDFGGHTYTMDGAMVGSTGTQTQAFQLLKDNKITFKNGTIYSEKALFLVQNYSDLTLEGMTLTLNNTNYTSAYTLSNNNGNIVIDGTTINANPAGGFAFDVCRYSSYTSVNVEVKGESVINGDIEISASGSDAKDGFGLTLTAGTLNGSIVVDATAAAAMAATPDKAVIAKANTFTQAAPEGYKWVEADNGMSNLVACDYVAKVGTLKFETLKEAFEAATDGTTITLLKDETLSERIACTLTSGSFTIALGDYTLSKGVYSVTLLPGVAIYTDKETDIFTTSEGAIQKVANGDSGFIYSVDPNGIVTSINGRILDEQVEGIYSTNGMKQDRLMPGMNIIRYANGKTKTVLVK